ncbi:MAG TPA: DUF3108 domain-containing protein [Burkholderiaceae bacterium]|nr:DUF3108 domain-containing protein [Burkholderiaceae bacterium]
MKICRFLRNALLATILSSAWPAMAQDHAATRYKVNLPPSAELGYVVNARQSGFAIEGNARVAWHAASGQFTLETEMRAMLLGKIMDAKTEGVIDEYGLAPVASSEKRFRKQPTTVSFDREAKVIRFSGSDATYPIKGGEQDRNSAIWQLIAVARAAPAKFRPGSEWTFFVAGQRDAEPWVFRVAEHEKIQTPLGDLQALHVVKAAPVQTQKIDIWLAPSLEWYPARLRYTDPDGDFIEQSLVSMAKKPA